MLYNCMILSRISITRHPELPAEKVLLWEPTHGQGKKGKTARHFPGHFEKRCRIGEHWGTEDVHGRPERLQNSN